MYGGKIKSTPEIGPRDPEVLPGPPPPWSQWASSWPPGRCSLLCSGFTRTARQMPVPRRPWWQDGVSTHPISITVDKGCGASHSAHCCIWKGSHSSHHPGFHSLASFPGTPPGRHTGSQWRPLSPAPTCSATCWHRQERESPEVLARHSAAPPRCEPALQLLCRGEGGSPAWAFMTFSGVEPARVGVSCEWQS